MTDNSTSYYELFKQVEEAADKQPSKEHLQMEADLSILSAESKKILSDYYAILPLVPAGSPMTLDGCREFAAALAKVNREVVLAIGIYVTMREEDFRRVRKPQLPWALSLAHRALFKIQKDLTDREEILTTAMFLAWCCIWKKNEELPPTNDFYKYFFSYRDAVIEIANYMEAYLFFLEQQHTNDRTWYGGSKPIYAKTLKLIESAVELATVGYSME